MLKCLKVECNGNIFDHSVTSVNCNLDNSDLRYWIDEVNDLEVVTEIVNNEDVLNVGKNHIENVYEENGGEYGSGEAEEEHENYRNTEKEIDVDIRNVVEYNNKIVSDLEYLVMYYTDEEGGFGLVIPIHNSVDDVLNKIENYKK